MTHEWWRLAENDVLEMTRRGVPGVWTYGYYDGWMPNYMFFIAHSHNAIGRFYEVQGYGPDPYEVRPDKEAMSKEWFRPSPPVPFMKWGPRNSVNIQQSALLFALQHVARNRDTYLDNYWLKNKRSVEKGRSGPTFAWVIPAGQRRKSDAADAVNELRRQGLEISVASSSFRVGAAGDVDEIPVKAGDYIVRADQPFRTLAAMYFAVQKFPRSNRTAALRRHRLDVPAAAQPQRRPGERCEHPESRDDAADWRREGARRHRGRRRDAGGRSHGRQSSRHVPVQERRREDAGGGGRFRGPRPRKLQAGSIVVPNADRQTLGPQLEALGLSAWAQPSAPAVSTHDLDVPRIGYVHSWTGTQDEGWWRAAFDTYGIPYSYFADQKLREGNLRAKYDVIVFPNVGGTTQTRLNGVPISGGAPLPYKRSASTPNLGVLDSSDDIRGGMGLDGVLELEKFVRQGGTLITEGSTAAVFSAYGITPGVRVDEPAQLFVHGSVLRGVFTDKKSPIAYGYDTADLPVYFNQTPVFTVDARAAGENAVRPRVVMQFPANAGDILLSGSLANGQQLANHALVVDEPLGSGHIVMFALRPFWRWQTQGAYSLVFNTILHWNDLDARTIAFWWLLPVLQTSSSSAPASSGARWRTSWRAAARRCRSWTIGRPAWAPRRRRPACSRRTPRPRIATTRFSTWPCAALASTTISSPASSATKHSGRLPQDRDARGGDVRRTDGGASTHGRSAWRSRSCRAGVLDAQAVRAEEPQVSKMWPARC